MDKDFITGIDSNAKKSPRRVAFITRRTSAQVKVTDEQELQTYPELLFRIAVAIEVLFIILVITALLFNAPLEGLADPSHTPNPAKAPWYFLGLQELLHYFPPVVAGVLAPGLVVMALIVIPYFNINIEAEGVFLKDRRHRLTAFGIVAVALTVFLFYFDVYVSIPGTVIIAALMGLGAFSSPQSSPSRWEQYVVRKRRLLALAVAAGPLLLIYPATHEKISRLYGFVVVIAVVGFVIAWFTNKSPASASSFERYLSSKPLSFWIMTWFLIELVVLTAVGTFFRGPGWSWVLPWRSY